MIHVNHRGAPAVAARGLRVWALRAIAVFVAGLVSPVASEAQEVRPPVITRLSVGFGGHYKLGVWTPVSVTIRGGGERLTGALEAVTVDGDGTPSRTIASEGRPIQLLPNRETTATVYVRFGQEEGELTIALRVDGKIVMRKIFRPSVSDGALELPWPAGSDQRVVVTVGGGIGVEQLFESAEYQSQQGQSVGVTLDRIDQLPNQWYGYEGVDTLVLATASRDIFSQWSENSATWQALEKWLRLGGKVILTAGATAQDTFAAATPLAKLAPGRVTGLRAVRQTTSFEAYANSNVRVPRPAAAAPLAVPVLEDVRGVVSAREANLPLVVRAPHEFGEVVFVAADLDRRPFVDWEGRAKFVGRLLLDADAEVREKDDSVSSVALQLGISDLSGQLRGALDDFVGIRLIPFSVVALAVFIYVLLIGPADYFFVRKVLGRMEWTWLTFPLIVVAVSGLAYAVSYAAKGTDLRINQVDIVDVDVVSHTARGASFQNVFSPRTQTYDFAYHVDSKVVPVNGAPETIVAWLGLPGGALGGMEPRNPAPMLFSRDYSFTPPLDAMDGVPISVWSTKSLVARWSGETTATIVSELKETQPGVIRGTVRHDLAEPLENALVVYGRYAYQLKTLAPGQSGIVDPIRRDDLQSVLKNVRILGTERKNEFIQRSTPWDPYSRDIPAIVQQMMFNEAAGGRGYTGMWNRYQEFIDLSDQLSLGRAILVASSENRSAGAFVNGGEPLGQPDDRRWVFYRFLLPVTPAPPEDPNEAAVLETGRERNADRLLP